MREEILELEELSRLLEPTTVERASVREKVVSYSEEFLEAIEKKDAFTERPPEGFPPFDSPITEAPEGIDTLIELLKNKVDKLALNPASGGHLGYIPGGGLYYSALGDYLADIFNRYAGLYTAGPGAVSMENMLIRWMAELVGFPAEAAGNLTTGGSLAHLIAVVTARDAKNIRPTDVARPVIYFSEQHHHSLDKALRVAGLRECLVRRIPLDAHCRMIASELEKQIEWDKKEGRNPFLVVATAGTTDVGAIDPLKHIGEICQKHGIWYHIDAAYGGFFILTSDGRNKLNGLELADSLVMDPHKGLFLPYGLGVVLVKDKQALYNSFYHEASYIPPPEESDEPSPGDYSPELTKHFRGLRLWLPLKLLGLKPFRACLEEKLLLAKYFHSEIKKRGFQVGPEPDLSVVAYRYVPKGMADDLAELNKFNEALLERVNADGRVFISDTKLDGISQTKLDRKYFLRFACLSFRTHLNNVDTLIEILESAVESLLGERIPRADVNDEV
jgi:glutamate/tyrosine decarboxylase-like PLP-dependent enzyme